MKDLMKACESPVESALLAALLRESDARGLHVVPQHRVLDYRIDFAVTRGGLRMAVEVDGHDFHERTKEQAEHDRSRDRKLTAAGWVVLRFTGAEVARDAGACAQEVFAFADRHAPSSEAVATVIGDDDFAALVDARIWGRECEQLRHGISSLHPWIDHRTGGIETGDCWLLAADTGWGKSTYASAVAAAASFHGVTTILVSSEDPVEQYAARVARCLESVTTATKKQDLQVFIRFLDARAQSAELVAMQVAHELQSAPGALVIYDFIQEFRSGRRYNDRRTETDAVAALLRDPVRRFGARGLFLSQITPVDGEKIPTRHWVRDSRGVAHASDVILCGFTPPENITTANGNRLIVARGGKALHLDKNKFGRSRAVAELAWHDGVGTFWFKEDAYGLHAGELHAPERDDSEAA